MYRLAVCDDEPLFLEIHQSMAACVLREAGIVFEIDSFLHANALMRQFREQSGCFDMLILDILLDGENGMELARLLRNTDYQGGILFATSSKDYSLEGYSVHPVHYLLKPIDRTALRDALLRDYHQRFQPPTLTIEIRGGYTAVPLDNILYIESLLRSLIIHTKGQSIETAMPLKEIKGLLPSNMFVQCHKSFLVRMGNVRSITRAEITLDTGLRLPVGRVYYAEALTTFIDYMAGK